MGKKAKEHRKKVAKRNANIKQQEKMVQKIWQQAFDEQMKIMKEKFETMSGDTTPDLTGLLENEEKTVQKESEPTEPISEN
jgi:hypothetical protein